MTDLYKAMMPCPRCHGNGYVRDKEVHVDCDLCNSQGEVPTTADIQEQEGQQ